MKYLKKFNENIDDPTFRIVDKGEAAQLSIDRKLDKFTKNEIEYLGQLFQYNDMWKRVINSGSTLEFGTSKILYKHSCKVYISKYDDDWFIMSISPRNTYKEYYFIIDTREGFEDLMDEVNNMDLV